jgi:uncharacterized protein YifE (UPF0438 family)
MSTREDHLRLLRRGSFPVPPDVPGLTANERQLLVARGFWLEALAGGALTPLTDAQERFVEVAQGRAVPVSQHEQAWVKIRPSMATRPSGQRAARPAGLSPDDEDVLRRMRGMLARGEVASGFADSVLRQWEESRRVTPKQLAAIRRLVARVEGRASVPRVVTGSRRKPGSHRSNW